MRAPFEVDDLGLLSLSLFSRWERNAVFVLVVAHVDESGTGGGGRVTLGALVAKAHAWHAFHTHWRKLLCAENIEYSHLTAMENGKPPFEDWNTPRCKNFVAKARKRWDKNCDFQLIATVTEQDFSQHYKPKLSKWAPSVTPYALCSRVLIECVTREAVALYGENTVVNFVFEDSHHFEHARQAFRYLKDFHESSQLHLGHVVPGEKTQIGGLQAADIIAILHRRASILGVEPAKYGSSKNERDGHLRVLMHELDAETLARAVEQSEALGLANRLTKRNKNFQKWRDKKYGN